MRDIAAMLVLLALILFADVLIAGAIKGANTEVWLARVREIGSSTLSEADWSLPALITITVSIYIALLVPNKFTSTFSDPGRIRNQLGLAAEGIGALGAAIILLSAIGQLWGVPQDNSLYTVLIVGIPLVWMCLHAGSFVYGTDAERYRAARWDLVSARLSSRRLVRVHAGRLPAIVTVAANMAVLSVGAWATFVALTRLPLTPPEWLAGAAFFLYVPTLMLAFIAPGVYGAHLKPWDLSRLRVSVGTSVVMTIVIFGALSLVYAGSRELEVETQAELARSLAVAWGAQAAVFLGSLFWPVKWNVAVAHVSLNGALSSLAFFSLRKQAERAREELDHYRTDGIRLSPSLPPPASRGSTFARRLFATVRGRSGQSRG